MPEIRCIYCVKFAISQSVSKGYDPFDTLYDPFSVSKGS